LIAIPLITAMGCLLPMRLRYSEMISSFGGVLTSGIAFVHISTFLQQGVPLQRPGIYLDGLSAIIIFIIATVGTISALYAVGYMRKEIAEQEIEEKRIGKFYALFHLFIATMYMAVLADNLGVMWVAIEATTIVSALLVGFSGQKAALEAAWKYIIICTVGIAFAMLGIILTFYATQGLVGEGQVTLSWHFLYTIASGLNPSLMKLAFIFIFVGYGTKAGIFPLHTWLPDAHSQAPSPVSALLSGVLLNCAIYAIFRFHLLITATGTNFSSNLMVAFGIISMVGAFPFILVQKDIKRLLAYSSVEHVGIIILGIGLGGTLGYTGALLHLVNHALGKGTLFLCAGTIVQKYHTKFIQKMQGVGQLLPATGTIFLAALFAIGGAPPFGLFVSEMGVATRAFQVHGFGLGFVFLISVAAVFTGLIYFGGKMVFSDLPLRYKNKEPISFSHVLLFVPIVLLVFQGIYMPDSIQAFFAEVVEAITIGGGMDV